MALPAFVNRMSPAEYLALERQADVRSEYIDGEIVAMAGATLAHNQISVNLTVALAQALRAGPCRPFAADMRVKVADTDLYTYPDIVVVCGEPLFEDSDLDTLLNPTVLVEILSPTTEAYDRGAKFARYRRIESLQEYVLVSQDRPQVERFLRRGELWEYTAVEGIEAAVPLDSLGISLSLRDVYDRVEFGAEGGETGTEPSSGT